MTQRQNSLLLTGRILLALALLLAIAGQHWIFYKVVDFAAYVVLTWNGITRLGSRRWLSGGAALATGTLFYPLIASVLRAADVVGAFFS